MMEILNSTKPAKAYTHTPNPALRARYKAWVREEMARRAKVYAPLDRPASRNIPDMIEAILELDPNAFDKRVSA